MKAFWTILSLLLILNRFFFEIAGRFTDINFQFGSYKISDRVSISLVILASICLVLDYFERNDKIPWKEKKRVIRFTLNNKEETINIELINSKNELSEEIKSINDLLFNFPLIEQKTINIESLQKEINSSKEIDIYSSPKLIQQAIKLANLKKDIERTKNDLNLFLRKSSENDILTYSELYQRALFLFLEGDIVLALNILNETTLSKYELDVNISDKIKGETRLLKARILKVSDNYTEAHSNFEKALNFNTGYSEVYETALFFKEQNNHSKAEKLFLSCLNFASSDKKKADVLHVLASIFGDKLEFEEAKKYYLETIQIRRSLATTNNKEDLKSLANSIYNLSIFYLNQKQLIKAEEAQKESTAIRMKLVKQDPTQFTSDIAYSLNLEAAIKFENGNHKEGWKLIEKSLRIFEKLEIESPSQYLSEIARANHNLGRFLYHSDKKNAEKYLQLAVEQIENLYKSNPEKHGPDTATFLNTLAGLQFEIGQTTKAEKKLEKAVTILEKLFINNPKNNIRSLALTMGNLASAKKANNNGAGAYKIAQRSLLIVEELAKINPTLYRPNLARQLYNFGNLLRDLGQFEKAELKYLKSLDIRRDYHKENPQKYLSDLASVLINLSNLYMILKIKQFESLKLINEAIDLLDSVKENDEFKKLYQNAHVTRNGWTTSI